MAIRMTGMYSNLDTDSIISQLMKAKRTKIEAIEKKQTKTEWKMDAWKALNTKIYSLYTGNLTSMRFSDFYSDKTASISNSNIATVTANKDAVTGTRELTVEELAKSGSLTGARIDTTDSSKLSENSTMSSLGYSSSEVATIDVAIGTNVAASVSITGSMKIKEVIAGLRSAGVNASFDATNKRIFIDSSKSGADTNFTLMASSVDGINAMNVLGLNAASDITKAEYQKWSSYQGYSYAENYTGADSVQIKYNADYEAIYASRKNTLETQKANAEKNLETILKKYKTDYTSADKETVYNNLVAQKDTLTTKKTDLDTQITDYNTKIKEAKKVIANPNSTAAEKTAATTELNAAQTNLTKAKASLAETTTVLTDIENATSNQNTITTSEAALDETTLANYIQNKMQTKAVASGQALLGSSSSEAVKIEGQDAKITLNGATFTSSTNAFVINGLTIEAKEKTDSPVSITTNLDSSGIYTKIKGFLTEYNSLIKQMDSLYNADSAKGYEPLTDEEKDAMTDSQVEKWETKIKDALLRRDNTLGDVTSVMKSAMSSIFTIDGTKYSLASFGISTGSYFTTEANEKGVYHIDGDTSDASTSGNKDKLKTAIAANPEAVSSFFSKLSEDLYKKLDSKMKSIDGVRTVYHVYEDKKMASEIKDYKSDIKELEKKIQNNGR